MVSAANVGPLKQSDESERARLKPLQLKSSPYVLQQSRSQRGYESGGPSQRGSADRASFEEAAWLRGALG